MKLYNLLNEFNIFSKSPPILVFLPLTRFICLDFVLQNTFFSWVLLGYSMYDFTKSYAKKRIFVNVRKQSTGLCFL